MKWEKKKQKDKETITNFKSKIRHKDVIKI